MQTFLEEKQKVGQAAGFKVLRVCGTMVLSFEAIKKLVPHFTCCRLCLTKEISDTMIFLLQFVSRCNKAPDWPPTYKSFWCPLLDPML